MKDIRKVIGLLLCMTICCYMTGEEKKNLNIVFIGNSITQGALLENPRHEAPPVKAALYLRRQPSVGTVRYSNQGVRSKSLGVKLSLPKPTYRPLSHRATQLSAP